MKAGDPKILKLERQLNLVSFLLSARAPVPFSKIRRGRVVGYDDDASPHAVEKAVHRDKVDLRSIGVNIEYIAGDVFGGPATSSIPAATTCGRRRSSPRTPCCLASCSARSASWTTASGPNLKSALAKLTIDSLSFRSGFTSVGEQHLLTLGRPEKDRRAAALLRRPGGGASAALSLPLSHDGSRADGDAQAASLCSGARGREPAGRGL